GSGRAARRQAAWLSSRSPLSPTITVTPSCPATPQAQALVVTVAGEVDVLTIKRLRAALAAGFDQLRGGEVLIIDLTDVTFLGSPGLQTAAGPRRLPWFGWP
ncbi:MAG TPA: STAS domain-containing protein, partial [Pseudonocardiaceae bacterium]|nr:STAS domain-containing protein [Pseudonocardiaceae bacterium]